MAYTTLVAGTTITAAWANASVRDQSVSPFASAAARSSAISSPVEGMVSHLNDTNCLGVYSGAAWSSIGPAHGVPLSWTPVVQQGAGVAATINWAVYSRLGRWVFAQFHLSMTAGGSAGSAIIIGGIPVTAGGTGFGVLNLGNCSIVDASDSNRVYPGQFNLESSTTLSLHGLSGGSAGDVQPRMGETSNDSFAVALASGDTISGTFNYVAVADA